MRDLSSFARKRHVLGYLVYRQEIERASVWTERRKGFKCIRIKPSACHKRWRLLRDAGRPWPRVGERRLTALDRKLKMTAARTSTSLTHTEWFSDRWRGVNHLSIISTNCGGSVLNDDRMFRMYCRGCRLKMLDFLLSLTDLCHSIIQDECSNFKAAFAVTWMNGWYSRNASPSSNNAITASDLRDILKLQKVT